MWAALRGTALCGRQCISEASFDFHTTQQRSKRAHRGRSGVGSSCWGAHVPALLFLLSGHKRFLSMSVSRHSLRRNKITGLRRGSAAAASFLGGLGIPNWGFLDEAPRSRRWEATEGVGKWPHCMCGIAAPAATEGMV